MENGSKTGQSSVVCTDASISAEGINKHFGKVQALDNINLVVDPGTVFALLGPNGSGKTTLVRIFTTLLRPDSGTAMSLAMMWFAKLSQYDQLSDLPVNIQQ